MAYGLINSINMQRGLDVSSPVLSPASQEALDEGTWNAIVSGSGFTRPWGGASSQGSGTGSEKMLPFGNTWGGIKAASGVASGSFFQDIGKSRWGIGQGTPHIEGTNVSGFTLSTNLQLQIASAGTYASPVQAGLAQPSAPTVGIVASPGDISNSISVKIERTRPATGARSVASPTSAVITPQANRLRVTFPSATTGQTHWRVYFTFQGFGGTGVHYLGKYSTYTDIPESTVSAGTVDGVARSLEFNFKDGDLIPIEASFDDYAPPAATHALRLQTVLNLIGCYADSTNDPTSSSPGTAIAVSKENNYESYVPTSLLFLPEQVVDVLARPIDDYGYIACENSIHALQYVGSRGDSLPSCTLTTILPDIGIQYATNWCQFRGRLLLYPAPGNLMMMNASGEFDTSFAAPVSKILKGFTTAATSVGYDPKTDSIVVLNGMRMLVYSLQSGQWRQIWLPDFSLSGTGVSMVTAKRTLYFTLVSGGTNTAYSYDTASATAQMSFCSNYQAPNGATLHDIYEAAVAAQSTVTSAIAVVINRNLSKTVFRRITTNGTATITDVESGFTSDMVGKVGYLFAPNIDGVGGEYLPFTVASYSNTSQIVLTVSRNPTAATEVLMFVGNFKGNKALTKATHVANFFPYIAEARSHQVAVWIKGTGDSGNVLSVDLLGAAYSSNRAL